MSDTQSIDTPTPDGIEGAGFAAMHDQGGKPQAWQDQDDVTADVLRASEEVGALHAERDAFDRSHDAREGLRTRYPETRLSELVTNFMQWDQRFKADPRDAADQLSRYYLSQPAYELKKAKEAAAPAARADDASGDDPEGDVRAAMRAFAQGRADDAEFEATAEQRAALKEAFPYLNFDQAIERLVTLDRALRDDPVGAAGRLAASYGLPVTTEQKREAARVAEFHERSGTVAHDIGGLVQSGHFPGIEHMMDEITAIVSSPQFPHSGDPLVDIARGYQAALPGVLRERQAHAVESARHASGSIAGSPAPGVPVGNGYRPNSALEDDIRDAMRWA